MRTRRDATRLLAGTVWLAAVVTATTPAAAHSGTLRAAAPGSLSVPTWLFLVTGGAVVGASFLLASFVTDRAFIARIHGWGRVAPVPGRLLRAAGRLAGVAVLAATVTVGFVGPDTGIRNLAILTVWVVWWGGYVASTYLLGNSWPAVNPFRTLADLFPSLDRPYPERLGAWPSVAGLLALVWVEVVSPLADDPKLLAAVVSAYAVVTVAGAVVFGSDRWFETVDPVARAFRYYGEVAPLAREDGRLRVRLPAAGLRDTRLLTGWDETAFVVVLLFVTTYDGFVATGLWAGFARAVVGVGLPPTLVYLTAYLVGAAAFVLAFRWAVLAARRYGDTYVTPGYIARRFAPSLLAIAAGYHLAHNLGTMLSLSPALLSVASAPLAPPQNPPVLAGLPAWFGGLELTFVLAGHLLAVWVAHATAYDVFPGRLQAVRTQYGVTLVMVLYTMTSLWIVSEPYVPPPYLA